MERVLEWGNLKAQIVEREETVKIKTVGCTCGSGACMRARNHKCVCSCGGLNHAILFKEKNKISGLDDYGVGNPLTPDSFIC